MNYNYQKTTRQIKITVHSNSINVVWGRILQYEFEFVPQMNPLPKHFFSKNGVSIIGLYIIHKRTHRYTKRCTVHTKYLSRTNQTLRMAKNLTRGREGR